MASLEVILIPTRCIRIINKKNNLMIWLSSCLSGRSRRDSKPWGVIAWTVSELYNPPCTPTAIVFDGTAAFPTLHPDGPSRILSVCNTLSQCGQTFRPTSASCNLSSQADCEFPHAIYDLTARTFVAGTARFPPGNIRYEQWHRNKFTSRRDSAISGINSKIVQEQLGHSSLNLTLNTLLSLWRALLLTL